MRILIILGAICSLFPVGGMAADTSNEAVSGVKPPTTLEQREKWRLLVGKWYGSQPTKEGGIRRWIVERHPQGRYRIVFRIYDEDATSYREQIEVGEWGVSGPVYFTILRGWVMAGEIERADPSDPYNYDAYKIVELTDQEFEYEGYDSGNKFLVKKVPDDFDFPDDT